jgi:hypothetical protein
MSTHLPLSNMCTGCGGTIEQARINILGPDVELCASCAHYQELVNKHETGQSFTHHASFFTNNITVPRESDQEPLLTSVILLDQPRKVSAPWTLWTYMPEPETPDMEVCFDGELWARVN